MPLGSVVIHWPIASSLSRDSSLGYFLLFYRLPLLARWSEGNMGVEKCTWIPSSSHIAFNFFAYNCVSLSEIIELGTLNRHIIFFHMNLHVLALVIITRRSTSTQLVKYSIATIMNLILDLVLGNGPTKSIFPLGKR